MNLAQGFGGQYESFFHFIHSLRNYLPILCGKLNQFSPIGLICCFEKLRFLTNYLNFWRQLTSLPLFVVYEVPI